MVKISDLQEGPERDAMEKQFGADADVMAIAKSLIETKNKLSSTRRVPEPDAPAEERAKLYDYLGRPASAAEYKVPEASESLRPVIDRLRNVAYERGLSQEQFEAMATEAGAVSAEADGKLAEARKAWVEKLREQHGDKTDERIATAKRQLDQVLADDPVSKEIFERFHLDRFPAIVNAMIERNNAMGDDATPGVGLSPPADQQGPTAVELYKEGMEVMRSEAYKGGDRHPENKIATARVTEILAHLQVMGYDGFKDARFRQRPTVTLPDGTRIM